MTKLSEYVLQTPYNSNKCVALTSSQLSKEERAKKKIQLVDELSFTS